MITWRTLFFAVASVLFVAAAAKPTSADLFGPLGLPTKALELEGSSITADDAGAGEEFGLSVSVARDWAVVGAPGDDPGGLAEAGSAYVYHRVDGAWTFFDKLIAESPAAGDNFGFSVSIGTPHNALGSVVAVGAPRTDETTGLGRAFYYECWVDTGACEIDSTVSAALAGEQVGDLFGYSVATDGYSLAVGSPYRTNAGGTHAGSVQVVHLDTVGNPQTTVTAEDADSDDYFGTSVAVSGSKLVVGSPGDDHFVGTDAGSVYVYQIEQWSCPFVEKLMASDLTADSGFGWTVATHFDLLVAGAPKVDLGEAVDAGAAYVFSREDGGAYWTERQKLVADDGVAGDHFGGAVSVSSYPEPYRVVVGAPFTDHSGAGSGTAYAFSSFDEGNSWTIDATLTHPAAAGSDFFGFAVDVSEDTVFAGAPEDDHDGLADAGSAHVFEMPLFACDFESGGTLGWSVTVP